MKAQYIHNLGIDEPLAMEKNSNTYYYHADGLGSVVALSDSTGAIVQKYAYDSFGNITSTQNPAFKQPYTYTGREWDEETGMYYYRARYYDPKAGKFLSKDPIGFIGGINLYTYVWNDPINWIDPMGLQPSGLPSVPVPGGGADNGWKWNPDQKNSRGGSFGPKKPVKGQSQPSASWDPEGHWDVDDGQGNRERYDDKGKPLTPEEAHGKDKCNENSKSIAIGESYFDKKYWEKVTGLTGSALIIYLIVSEGSRLYPPRNLVPIP